MTSQRTRLFCHTQKLNQLLSNYNAADILHGIQKFINIKPEQSVFRYLYHIVSDLVSSCTSTAQIYNNYTIKAQIILRTLEIQSTGSINMTWQQDGCTWRYLYKSTSKSIVFVLIVFNVVSINDLDYNGQIL